ncbi:MAG: toll/interleukin-1 receptor domain-containing protein [Clostridia bacterium]|nr:toll/interleukin-1 receptor domain-containing protein [Clostridia bacterium]
MKNELEYGPVLVTKGKYKGRIGVYDDDEGDRIVVFSGNPSLCLHYYMVKRASVSSVISTEYLAKRIETLDSILGNYEYGLESRRTQDDIIDLMHEKILCDDLLTDRYIHSIQRLTQGEQANVFISHASSDLAYARWISTDLMEAGFSVFLDDWSINVGDRIFEKINKGLEESTAFVMIISRNYLSSVCCNDEWTAFYSKMLHNDKYRLYPIIIDDSDPPPLLSQIKYLRINEDDPDSMFESSIRMEKLIQSLRDQFETH